MPNKTTQKTYSRRAVVAAMAAAVPASSQSARPSSAAGKDLGIFSVSLAVKDLEASIKFYEKLGFRPMTGVAGRGAQRYVVLKNGDAIIGLFQGMFDKNILTFNPGWDNSAQKKPSFTDVREIQRQLKADGVQIAVVADENTKGPASFVVFDPDGNQIIVDQHV